MTAGSAIPIISLLALNPQSVALHPSSGIKERNEYINYRDKMKTKFFYLTLIFMLVAGVAQANDYLEKKKHY